MEYYYIMIGARFILAVALAVLMGSGSVVVFNHLPAQWFKDDGKLPEDIRQRQRVPGSPWKFVFTGILGVCGLYMAAMSTLQYELAVLFALFIVLEMAIADWKYMVVPDQLNILLAVSALGFIGMNEKWWEPLAGAGAGLALGVALLALGYLVFHREAIGGADLKFLAAMGLVAGRSGILWIFVLTTLAGAVHGLYLVAFRGVSLREHKPMLPYAFVGTAFYFVLLKDYLEVLSL